MMFRRDTLCPGARMCPGAPDDATPCMECPLAYLDAVLESPLGAQLRNIVDLDFAVTARFAVDLDAVAYDDFRMLRALHEEREAYRQDTLQGTESHKS